jgi:hypothetical protein
MEIMEESYKIIEKEEILNLSFGDDFVVNQPSNLKAKLAEATKLGNLFHGKIRIVFQSDQGKKAIETTIWATGNQYIALKGGMWLPISRIESLEFV